MNKFIIALLSVFILSFGSHAFGASTPLLIDDQDGEGDQKNLSFSDDFKFPTKDLFKATINQFNEELVAPALKQTYVNILCAYLHNKTSLNFTYSDLGFLSDSAVAVLCPMLPIDLKELGISCVELTYASLELILKRCIELKSLELYSCSKPSDEIVSLIKENANLTHLYLWGSCFTECQLISLIAQNKNLSITIDFEGYSFSHQKTTRRMYRKLANTYKRRIFIENDDDDWWTILKGDDGDCCTCIIL